MQYRQFVRNTTFGKLVLTLVNDTCVAYDFNEVSVNMRDARRMTGLTCYPLLGCELDDRQTNTDKIGPFLDSIHTARFGIEVRESYKLGIAGLTRISIFYCDGADVSVSVMSGCMRWSIGGESVPPTAFVTHMLHLLQHTLMCLTDDCSIPFVVSQIIMQYGLLPYFLDFVRRASYLCELPHDAIQLLSYLPLFLTMDLQP